MKKSFKTYLLILVFGFIFNPATPTFAAIKDKGTTWWSVTELLEFYQEVEAEKATECGNNEECKMEFNYSMIDRGLKYSALNNLLEAQIWVTSVNPAAETVKILFFDDDMMLKSMGIQEKLHLEHLYMGWIEDWNGQIYSYDHEQFTDGSLEGNHIMYDGNTSSNGADWIPAWNEYELSVAGSNLSKNTLGRIDYAAFAEDNMYNAQGYFDYSDCLNSPYYQEGMECKMMISGDQWVTYSPLREETESENSVSIISDEATKKIVLSESPVIESINIKAPDTGSMTNPCIQKTIEFPWWLMLLIALGDIVVLWIFWPKSQKNSKKTLDKINQVR